MPDLLEIPATMVLLSCMTEECEMGLSYCEFLYVAFQSSGLDRDFLFSPIVV